MIYSIQGGDLKKREAIVKALGSVLYIGESRIVRDTEIESGNLNTIMDIANFIHDKTGDVIVSTNKKYFTVDGRFNILILDEIPTSNLDLIEYTVNECVNLMIKDSELISY